MTTPTNVAVATVRHDPTHAPIQASAAQLRSGFVTRDFPRGSSGA